MGGSSSSSSTPKRKALVHEHVDHNVLNRYNVGRRIGRGCYGVVFEGETSKGHRPCAIKKILHAFRNATDAQRTYREVCYLLEFAGYARIVTLHDVIVSPDDRHLYLVFNLMDVDLHKALRNSELSSLHQEFITFQLLQALKYIHSAGVIHRDVKPSNILLNSTCDVKLADFGWARTSPVLDNEGMMTDYCATRWYRAPEMLLGARYYGIPVDMWSLGCTVCEMKARKPLFPGTSTIQMLEMITDSLGKPLALDMRALEAPYDTYFECMPSEPPRHSLDRLFQDAAPDFVDFAQLCLQVHPKKRMTDEEGMEHPHVGSFYNPDDKPNFGRLISLPLLDGVPASAARYRDQIYADIIGLPHAKRTIAEIQKRELREAEEERLIAESLV